MGIKKHARASAEEKFAKMQKTTVEANSLIDSERTAMRAKIARLREARLTKEASEGQTELDKKPARPRRATRPVR